MDKAVFLDRDGVINEVIYHQEIGIIDTPFTPEQFKLLPGVGGAIKKFHQLGFKVVVVSNQPGIAKNHFSKETFEKIREKMHEELRKDGASLDAEYYCFHHPNAEIKEYLKICDCRKPKPGLLIKASKELNIDTESSWMVGDSITDIKAGKDAGCRTVLIGSMKCDLCRLMDKEKIAPDYIVPDLLKITRIVNGGLNDRNISGYCKP